MNKKVLQSMIGLLWIFLAAFCVIKVFFGEWFLTVVENERILFIGAFIETHVPIRILWDTFISLIAGHFYLCSCCRVWKFSCKTYLFLACYFLIITLCYSWNTLVATVLDLAVITILPLLMRAKFSQTVAVFILHHLGQALVLFIRSEPLYLASTNYATQFFLLFDVYIWLTLYYLYSNYNKEETLWEKALSFFLVIKQKRNLKKSSLKPKRK